MRTGTILCALLANHSYDQMSPSNSTSDSISPATSLSKRLFSIANRNYFPWADRYVYWLKQPIGWLIVGAFAALLIGVFLAPQGWVMFAALTTLIAIGVVWPWVSMRGITCQMSFKRRRATEGDTVQVILRIRNIYPWPVWGLAVEGGFLAEHVTDTDDSTAVALARIPGWSTNEFVWDFEPTRRGQYPTSKTDVSNAFPFGIWSAKKSIDVVSRIIVWPLTVKLSSIPLVGGNEFSSAGVMMDRAGHEGDILAVRPYRQGDSLRDVHWAQTARHNRFIVYERQSAARRDIEVVIDTDPTIHEDCAQSNSLEWGIRVGASLIREFHQHGWNVTCTVQPQKHTNVGPQRSRLESTLDRLATLVPDETTIPIESLVNGKAKPTFRIIVTTAARMEQVSSQSDLGSATRFVVLDTQSTGEHRSAWLNINCNEDVASQLRKEWERRCHDTWSAN